MQKYKNLVTDTFFADGANIGGFMFKLKGYRDGVPVGEMRSQDSTNGVPNLLMNTESGYFHCINAEITGTINATGGNFTGTIALGDIKLVGSGGSTEGIYYKAPNASQNQYGEFSIQPKMFRTVPRDSLTQSDNTSLNVLTYMARERNNSFDRALYVSGISEFNGRVAISSYNSDQTTANISKAALFVEGILGVSDGLYGEPVVISTSCFLSPMQAPISGYKKNALIYYVTGNGITIDLQNIGDLCPVGTILIFITQGTNSWSLQFVRGIYIRNKNNDTKITMTDSRGIMWVLFPEKGGPAYAGFLS